MSGNSYNQLLYKVEFYNKNNDLLLKVGFDGGDTSKEFILEDDERIIGVKSKLYSKTYALHYDLVFIIGKLV